MGGGLWGALSSAATPLATAAGANQEGIQQGNEINTNNLLDTVKLYQQQAAAQLAKQTQQANLLKIGADTNEANARASALSAPPPRDKPEIHQGEDGSFYAIDPVHQTAKKITLEDAYNAGAPTAQQPSQAAPQAAPASLTDFAGQTGALGVGGATGQAAPALPSRSLRAPAPQQPSDGTQGQQPTAPQGLKGYVKPENETWTLSPEFVTKQDQGPVKVSNRGALQDGNGQPLTPQQVQRYVNPTANEGSWEITQYTKDGKIQEHNTKTGQYRDAPEGLTGKDQDNPQQLMQGTRGVQGARMMLLSHQAMAPFEAAASKDPSKFTGFEQFQTQFANDFAAGKITNLSAAERSAALVNLNKTNPDLAQYIRSGLYYAFGENELQQRPSDFRTKMSDYLATIGPAMNPAQIGQVSSMREESMKPAVEMAARLRQRMKLAPDPLFSGYLGTGTAPADNGGKIDAAHFAKLSPEDQAYFRSKGRAP